jgi:3-phenylpropionate/trans-cinnamate dioxygenase ferredoxin reductase subunit
MVREQSFVIVGGNLTAGAAASTLRTEGFDGHLLIVGAEARPPYERPPLSKEYLRGESTFEDASFLLPEWYPDNGVELLLGVRAARVEPSRREVHLEGGEVVAYDRLLIATGARNRRLSAPGHDLEGIFELRTVEDAVRIREAASGGRRRAVVIGAGFIGGEVAASLRSLGAEVHVVEVLQAPLERVVGAEVGRVIEGFHRDHGVEFTFGEAVERFEGSGGRVAAVLTDRGTRLDCDFVVVGVGVTPNTDLVEESEIFVENGIVVDQHCRTNVPDVFAAGDVANHFHPLFGRRVRVEHYDNALKQGAAAACAMMGREEVFDDPHWFWSDQYEHNLQYVGHAPTWDELVVRGSLEERAFVGFYLKDGLIDAAVGLNRGRDVRRTANLIRLRAPVDPAALRDEEVDLKKLAKQIASSMG